MTIGLSIHVYPHTDEIFHNLHVHVYEHTMHMARTIRIYALQYNSMTFSRRINKHI